MWNPFRRGPSEREMMIKVMETMQAVSAKQVELLEAWMNSYKVSSPPEVRVLRDIDEWRLEQERLEKEGKEGHPLPTPTWMLTGDV